MDWAIIRVPVTGFVNEGRPVDFGADGLREILELWLDADLMPELLAMYRRRGYTFVTLEEALADDVYALPEPDPPEWVRTAPAER